MNANGIEPLATPSKTQILSERLLTMARELGPDAQLPTFRELCHSFKVSKATLDHALRELEERGAILRRHGSGIYVAATVGRKTIGVVLGTNIFNVGFSPFWMLLLQAARTQLRARRYRFHAYLDFPQGEDLLAAHEQLEADLKARRLDGMLLIAAPDAEARRWLAQWNLPMVAVPTSHDASAWSVTLEPMLAAGVRELSRAGCRSIANLSLVDSGEFAAALAQAGLEFRPDRLWTAKGAGTKSGWKGFEDYGYRTVRECWNSVSPRVDGLVITDDVMARGALMALREAGVAVGRDLRIVVGANKGSLLLEPYARDLILFEYDPEELLAAAIAMLETLMSGGRPPVNPVRLAAVRRGAG
jgi:DNA-binding LacI/PurR family transcriptional regulator